MTNKAGWDQTVDDIVHNTYPEDSEANETVKDFLKTKLCEDFYDYLLKRQRSQDLAELTHRIISEMGDVEHSRCMAICRDVLANPTKE